MKWAMKTDHHQAATVLIKGSFSRQVGDPCSLSFQVQPLMHTRQLLLVIPHAKDNERPEVSIPSGHQFKEHWEGRAITADLVLGTCVNLWPLCVPRQPKGRARLGEQTALAALVLQSRGSLPLPGLSPGGGRSTAMQQADGKC